MWPISCVYIPDVLPVNVTDNSIDLTTRLCGDFYLSYGFEPEMTLPSHCTADTVRTSFKNYLKDNKGLLGHRSRDACKDSVFFMTSFLFFHGRISKENLFRRESELRQSSLLYAVQQAVLRHLTIIHLASIIFTYYTAPALSMQKKLLASIFPTTALSRGVRSLFGPTRKSSPWGSFSDGGSNQSIKCRPSL